MRVLLRKSARLVMGAFALACAVAPVLAEEASTPPAFPYGNDPDVAALVDVRRVRDPLCLGWTNGADQCRVQPDRSILCEIAGVDKKRGQIWCDKPDYERIGKVCRGFHNGCNWCERVLKVDGKWTAVCQQRGCPSNQSQVFPGIKCGLMPLTPISVKRI